MQIISSFQLLNGYKEPEGLMKFRAESSLMQPIQMLPYASKTDEWRACNMDWLERHGIEQITMKARHYSKNYRLADGIIDKSDYIPAEWDENKDLIDTLTREDDPTSALTELKFYPIIPNVVDLLVGEFIKRNNRVIAYAVDPLSKNEKLDKKKELVDQVLQQQAQMDIMENMMNAGYEVDSEEMQQAMSPENIQSLPEVETYMRKSYRSMVEQWAGHQIVTDRLRFRMDELEVAAYRDSIVVNEEVWEVQLLEDDYRPRVIDPRTSFDHKSDSKQYMHEGNFAGYIELMTVSDVIDVHGYKMSEDEILSLQQIKPATSVNTLLAQNYDGNVYDNTKSFEENVKSGSVAMKQYQAWEQTFGPERASHTLFDFLLEDDKHSTLNRDLFRVTTAYWKSQRKIFFLTKIDEEGNFLQDIVSEDYFITDKPLYDTTFYKEKTAQNLVFGEHLEPIWINEVWGGVKIGPNAATTAISSGTNGIRPIYLGVGNKKKPDRLPFQFKSESSLYGASLPMTGFRKPGGVVDRTKAFQVSYNIVNNQISDILIDEIGTVIILDQNTLPRHSMGEDWGKNNLAKAYVAMKNYQILPLDTTLANTESGVNFQNLTSLDASQTERLLGRIQLANYFKTEALSAIGITPERMGNVNSQQTATGTQVSVSNSYAQTEKYFTNHSDFLMPRVWELMLSAAQYYHSTGKKSHQLCYLNDRAEEIMFELPDSLDLLPRDVNVYCTTSFAAKELKQKLEQLALENNTTGATIYDLGRILTLETPTEILDALQESEAKLQRNQEQQMSHEQQIEQQIIQSQAEEAEKQRQFDAIEADKDRKARILEAEIKAGGYAGQADLDGNQQNDYLDTLKVIQSQQEYTDTMGFKREQESNKIQMSREQNDLKRQDLMTRKEISDNQLRIARENQTKAELEKRKKAREAKTKKKTK